METQQGVAKAKTREEVQGSVENRPPLLNLPIPPATLPILNNSKTAKKKVQSRQGATHAAWADIAGQPSTSARRVFCDPRTEDWRKSEKTRASAVPPPTPPIIRHSFRYPTLAPTAASVAGTTRESVRACADHKRRQAPGSSPTRDPALLHSLGHRNKTSSSPHASHALLSIEQKQRLLKKKKLFMQGFDPWTLRVF